MTNTLKQLINQGGLNQTPYNCTLLYYLGESLSEELNHDYEDYMKQELINPGLDKSINNIAQNIASTMLDLLSEFLDIPGGYLLMSKELLNLTQDSSRAILSGAYDSSVHYRATQLGNMSLTSDLLWDMYKTGFSLPLQSTEFSVKDYETYAIKAIVRLPGVSMTRDGLFIEPYDEDSKPYDDAASRCDYKVDMSFLKSKPREDDHTIQRVARVVLASNLTDVSPTGMGHKFLCVQMLANFLKGDRQQALEDMNEFLILNETARYWEDFIDWATSVDTDTSHEEDLIGAVKLEEFLAELMIRELHPESGHIEYSFKPGTPNTIQFRDPNTLEEQAMILGPSCHIRDGIF